MMSIATLPISVLAVLGIVRAGPLAETEGPNISKKGSQYPQGDTSTIDQIVQQNEC